MQQPLRKKRKTLQKNKKRRNSYKTNNRRHSTRLIRKYRDNYFMNCPFDQFTEKIQIFDIGYPSNICSFCNAIKWDAEKSNMCCKKEILLYQKFHHHQKKF